MHDLVDSVDKLNKDDANFIAGLNEYDPLFESDQDFSDTDEPTNEKECKLTEKWCCAVEKCIGENEDKRRAFDEECQKHLDWGVFER